MLCKDFVKVCYSHSPQIFVHDMKQVKGKVARVSRIFASNQTHLAIFPTFLAEFIKISTYRVWCKNIQVWCLCYFWNSYFDSLQWYWAFYWHSWREVNLAHYLQYIIYDMGWSRCRQSWYRVNFCPIIHDDEWILAQGGNMYVTYTKWAVLWWGGGGGGLCARTHTVNVNWFVYIEENVKINSVNIMGDF